MGYLLGILAFVLFFLSDYNDWRLGRGVLRGCFPLGGVLLTAGTLLSVGEPRTAGALRLALLVLAALFLALLVYSLFFALPAAASYASPGKKRRACTTGMYALCRHPGVLWFIGLYLCLWAAAGIPTGLTALLILLNVLLIRFEDRCVFPDVLEGYEEYRRETPFLFPTLCSIRTGMK